MNNKKQTKTEAQKNEPAKKSEPKKYFPLLSEEEYFSIYLAEYLSELKISIENPSSK